MIKNEIHGTYDRWSMVVLYDSGTGHITHSHQVVTTRGGVHPDKTTLEKEAREHAALASSAGDDRVSCLHVDPREIDLEAHYAVDLKTTTLLRVEPPRAEG